MKVSRGGTSCARHDGVTLGSRLSIFYVCAVHVRPIEIAFEVDRAPALEARLRRRRRCPGQRRQRWRERDDGGERVLPGDHARREMRQSSARWCQLDHHKGSLRFYAWTARPTRESPAPPPTQRAAAERGCRPRPPRLLRPPRPRRRGTAGPPRASGTWCEAAASWPVHAWAAAGLRGPDGPARRQAPAACTRASSTLA